MNPTKLMQRTEFHETNPPKDEAFAFVGAWELTGADFPPEIAEVRGHRPQGMIIYDPNGYMAVQISPGRDLPVPESYPLPVAESYEAFHGFVSYYGTYSVDWENQLITHQRVFMAPPADLSKPLIRKFELIDQDQVTLRPLESTNALHWRRLR